eukprot:3156721-Rhodomonas_salina.3
MHSQVKLCGVQKRKKSKAKTKAKRANAEEDGRNSDRSASVKQAEIKVEDGDLGSSFGMSLPSEEMEDVRQELNMSSFASDEDSLEKHFATGRIQSSMRAALDAAEPTSRCYQLCECGAFRPRDEGCVSFAGHAYSLDDEPPSNSPMEGGTEYCALFFSLIVDLDSSFFALS